MVHHVLRQVGRHEKWRRGSGNTNVFDVCQLLRRASALLKMRVDTRLKSGHSSCDWSEAERLVRGRDVYILMTS